MPLSTAVTFGDLLKQLRKRAGMTQAGLAAAVGYSVPFISNLELNQRLPDVQVIVQHFVPALGLQEEPHLAARLVELAAAARGERPPAGLALKRETRLVLPGRTVLIHGAAGGVGTFAVQLARWRGAYVIGTASGHNLTFLRQLGADEVIDYTTTRFEEAVRNVDVVLDTVGGETEQRSWGVLKSGGILVSLKEV
jgi:transcriptional regulator with XRE-family HTH domain